MSNALVSPLNSSDDDFVPDVPPAPRAVPKALRRQQLSSPDVWIPAIIAAVGIGLVAGAALSVALKADLFVTGVLAVMAIAFCGLGSLLTIQGWRTARRKLAAYEFGMVEAGTVLSCAPDLHVSVNGRNPWCIWYAFRIEGADFNGRHTTWSEEDARALPVGSKVAVAFLPDDPATSCLVPFI